MNLLLKTSLLFLLSLVFVVNGLFEDQIGKFDWRHQCVGKVTHAWFDKSTAGKKVVIGTEENVLASLSAGSGKIQWRHLLGSGIKGKLHSLIPIENGIIVAVSGTPTVLRAFEPSTGLLLWESTISKESPVPEFISWSSIDKDIISVEVIKHEDGSHHLVTTKYHSGSGAEDSTESTALPWFTSKLQCGFISSKLACLNNEDASLSIVDIQDEESNLRMPLSDLQVSGSVTLGMTQNHGNSPFLWLKADGKLFVFKFSDQGLSRIDNLPTNIQVVDAPVIQDGDRSKQYLTFVTLEKQVYGLGIYDVDAEELNHDLSGVMKFPDQYGSADLLSVYLSKKNDLTLRYLMSTSDHGVIYGSRKDFFWTRDESLASIAKVEMVDLPVSATDAAIEEEFGADHGGLLNRILKRLSSQFYQLMSTARDVVNGVSFSSGQSVETRGQSSLVRDRFGLHKLILVITTPGKIFAIDTLNGRIVWQRLLTGLNTDKMTLFVQRTSIHYPLEPQCVILSKDMAGMAVLFVFNPITGQPVGQGTIQLNYRVQQAVLIPHSEETEFLKPLLMLDDQNEPHVYPEADFAQNRLIQLADNFFVFTADRQSCVMRGFSLSPSQKEALSAVQIWQLNLCSGSESAEGYREEIGTIVARHPEEKVFSQGRVLADRSVLYKYLNPNLVVVTTEGWHAHHRGILNVYLVDVVSGSVVFSISHRRVLGPVHVVHAENWVVYSYYNEKFRRTELASLEFFEGKDQSNGTAFSSFTAPQPLVDRQAYIFPSYITAMKDTFSEKGMTAKHILLGLSNGWIQELPRAFLDPRRPVVAAATPEMREEGVMPYLPELPMPAEAMVNYNQTVLNVRGIYTTNSALESTCLVFAYGLDLFFTHVTPSRTFDVLNEDFEYFFIAAVLIGLTLASFITRRLASRKALRQAWK